ncbi:unnamed protein product [Camellia sinensis]
MAMFFKRLAKAAPIAFSHAFRDQPKSSFPSFRVPFGAITAISGGISYYYYFSSSKLVYLDQINEEMGPKPSIQISGLSLSCKTEQRSATILTYSASCIITRAPLGQDAEGKTKYVIRPYTPISDPDSKGYFDLLIKVYPDGKMSQHFASLKPGDVVEVKGPIEKLRYSPNMKKHIGMIAGGTGITPMLQVIEAILKNPEDNTQVSLLYANVSPDDILLKQKLDVLAASHPNLKIFYTVDKPSNNWNGGTGYISKDMAIKGLPGPSDDTLILVCGPPGMMNHISGDKAKDYSQGESLAYSRNLDIQNKWFTNFDGLGENQYWFTTFLPKFVRISEF